MGGERPGPLCGDSREGSSGEVAEKPSVLALLLERARAGLAEEERALLPGALPLLAALPWRSLPEWPEAVEKPAEVEPVRGLLSGPA